MHPAQSSDEDHRFLVVWGVPWKSHSSAQGQNASVVNKVGLYKKCVAHKRATDLAALHTRLASIFVSAADNCVDI